MSFVHLHTHSHYSLLDGLPKIPELVARAKEFGCPALALTDHGVLYGVVEFYKACQSAGLKPILGLEAYLALDQHTDRRARIDDDYYHLTLLAKNEQGYRNLLQLSTVAHLKGFYYKPRIDKVLLKTYGEGLLALSGCLRGEIPRLLAQNKYAEAKAVAEDFLAIFGRENFFLEVQKHPELPEQEIVNRGLFKLSAELGILPVATADSHYLHSEDAEAQDILVCVQTGKLVSDKKRLDMRGVDHSFKSPEEMAAQWAEHPEVVTNTLKVAELCQLELKLKQWAFPNFAVPEGMSQVEYLRQVVWRGAEEKFGARFPEEIKQRINYELEVIQKTGFATYFLIVSDYVRWARHRKIMATTRGSAAGSLVAYLMEITTVNPLDFRLPFERFLTVARPSPPDIDVDFADQRRGEVIEYVREKYGREKVAQIGTFGTMLPRAAVRDVTRVLGLPYTFGDRLAKMIPLGHQGFTMTVERALEENPDLRALYAQDAQVQQVLDLVRKVEGCARHASVHAAGVVIAPTQLTDFTPLQQEPKGKEIITQYDMHAVEEVGLVKMDMLGIRNLSILGHAVEIIKKTKGVEVELGHLPLQDEPTFAMLTRGETLGVFQLSGSGMTRYLKELKPTSIHDIMAMVALFRPGPMESIPEYIRRKHRPQLVSYLDPRLKKILERTYGILVYQDDVLLIAIELAGYTWEEADKLRKAMGKKIPREMIAQREKFLLGCVKGGMTRVKAEELWALIEPFAAYGFNKSHAASYAMVAYQTAYLKAHWPAEFVSAILAAEAGNLDKIAETILGAREMKITVLPPDINESEEQFTYLNDQTIRFGLLAIKNLGTDVVGALISERNRGGPYQNLEDFLRRARHKNLNKKSLESLSQSGAFDHFEDRAVLLHNIEALLAFNRAASEPPARQNSLFGGGRAMPELRLNLQTVSLASSAQKLAWEKELLGLYVTAHPLTEFAPQLAGKVVAIKQLDEWPTSRPVCLAGVLMESKKRLTKHNEAMLTAHLQDLSGTCELVVFPKAYQKQPELYQDGALLCIWGKGGGEERRIIAERAALLNSELLASLTPEAVSASVLPGSSASGRLLIRLPHAQLELLQTLRTFLSSLRGRTPVYLELSQGTQTRLIQTSFQVDPDPHLIQSLEALVGEGRVQVVN